MTKDDDQTVIESEEEKHQTPELLFSSPLIPPILFCLILAFSITTFYYALRDFDGQVLEVGCNKIQRAQGVLEEAMTSGDEDNIEKSTKVLHERLDYYEGWIDDLTPESIQTRDSLSNRVKHHLFDHSCEIYWEIRSSEK